MNVIDITLLVLLGGFVLYGFWFGIIHMVGTLVGVVLAAVMAGRSYDGVSQWLAPLMGGNENMAKVIAFLLVFIVVRTLIGFAFGLIEKLFKLLTIIPFLGTFNRLLGAAFGLIEGTLALGLLAYFASRFPMTAGFGALLQGSVVAHVMAPIGSILSPLLPLAVRAAQSVL